MAETPDMPLPEAPKTETPETSGARSILRRAVKSTLWVIIGLFLATVVTAILLTPQFLQFVLERSLSKEPTIVRVEKVSIPDIRQIVLTGVTVADEKGVWARVPEIAVRWHPRALLDGDLEITSVTIPRFQVDRLPEPKPVEDEDPFVIDWPRSLLAINLQSLIISRLELHVPAGLDSPHIQTMIGKVTAAAQFRDGLLLARLDAVRTDGVPERVHIKTDVNEPARQIMLDFVASSPIEGWIAHELARQAGVARAPVKLAFVGSGPPEKWEGALVLEAGNLGTAKLKLTAVAAPPADKPSRRGLFKYDVEEDRDLVIQGLVQLAQPMVAKLGVPEDLQTEVAPPIAVDGRLEIRQRVLATADFSLDNRQAIALSVRGSDPWKKAEIVAQVRTPLSVAETTVGPGEISANVEMKPQEIEVSNLNLRMDQVGTADFDLKNLKGSGSVVAVLGEGPNAGAVTFNVKGDFAQAGMTDGFRIYGPATWEFAGAWAADKQRLTLTQGRLGTRGFALTADGSYAVSTGDIAGKAQLRASDLGPITGGKYAGSINLDAEGRSQAQSIQLTLRGRAEGLDSAEVPNLKALGELDLSADLRGSLKGGGQGQINITSDAFVFETDGSMSDAGTLDARIEARPEDAAALSKLLGMTIDGESKLVAQVTGHWDSPSVRAKLDVPSIGDSPTQYRDLVLDLNVEDVRNQPNGNLILRGDGPIGYIRGFVRIESADKDHIAIKNILIDNPVATFTGDFELDRRTGVVVGELDGLSGDFMVLQTGLDVEAEGAFNLDVKMARRGAPDYPRQLITVAMQGRNMATVLADREAVTMEALDARGRILIDGGLLDAKALSSARGQLRLKGYRSSGLSLDDLSLSISDRRRDADAEQEVGPGNLNWTVKAQGDYYGDLLIDGAGGIRLGQEDIIVEMKRLTGTLVDRPLSLESTARYVSTDMGDRLEPVTLKYGNGRLNLDFETTAAGLRANMVADGVNIAIIPLIMGMPPFDGDLTGRAELNLDDTQATGAADFRLVVRESDEQDMPGFDLAFGSRLNVEPRATEGRLTINGDIKGKDLTGTLVGDIPINVTRGVARTGTAGAVAVRPALAVAMDRSVSARFDWNGPIRSLMAFMPPIDDLFEGHLASNISLGGTFDQPVLNGGTKLTKGRYEQLGFGTVLENMTVDIRFDNNAVSLETFTADDGGDGTITANGGFVLDSDWLPVGQLTASLKSAQVVNMDGVRAEVTGDMNYKRDQAAAILSGQLRIDRVEAGLNERLPREITSLEVREINKPGHANLAAVTPAGVENAITAPAAPKIAALTAIDLKVTAPRRLFVRGRGLDSEWSGDLTIDGAADRLNLRGTVELVRGVFSFAGKDFTLTQGTLRFDGGGRIDPVMNMRAEYESADITANLTLSGTLSRPEIALSSTPTLPQDEILSRILFGTSVQKLSALEAVQLASAVSSLASGGGFDVFGKARGVLGLDRLSIGSTGGEGTGTALTGGKYLTRDIYLEITTDTSTGESKAVVRYDITRKLQIEAGVGASDDSSVGVRWKEDY